MIRSIRSTPGLFPEKTMLLPLGAQARGVSPLPRHTHGAPAHHSLNTQSRGVQFIQASPSRSSRARGPTTPTWVHVRRKSRVDGFRSLETGGQRGWSLFLGKNRRRTRACEKGRPSRTQQRVESSKNRRNMTTMAQ